MVCNKKKGDETEGRASGQWVPIDLNFRLKYSVR